MGPKLDIGRMQAWAHSVGVFDLLRAVLIEADLLDD